MASRVGAVLAAIASLAVLAGWWFGNTLLASWLPGHATMKPLAALGFVLAGVALVLRSLGGSETRSPALQRVALLFAVVVAMIGVLPLVEHLFAVDLNADALLITSAVAAVHASAAGRVALSSAVNFILLGTALALLDLRSSSARILVQGCSVVAGFFGLLVFAGYLYGTDKLYYFRSMGSMALPASILFLVLALSLLAARPDLPLVAVVVSPRGGGVLARRMLPVVVVTPLLLGWLRLSGQRAGWYGTEFGVAIFAVLMIVIFSIVLWVNAVWLNKTDAERRAALVAIQNSADELRVSSERLQESETRFRLFMRYLPAAAFIKDAKGRYVYGNVAWREQFPHLEGELLGKNDRELWPADLAEQFIASDAVVLRDGAASTRVQRGTVNGTEKYWFVSKFLMQGPSGAQFIGGVSLDTTDAHQLENQLSQARKLEAIGLLAGGVAHDFNNLLTVILGYSDANQMDVARSNPLFFPLSEIRAAALQAADLTAQLLAFGRKQVIRPQRIEINATLRGAESILRRLLRENVAPVFSYSGSGLVRSDPGQIRQVVINLVMNAQDAMPDGGRVTVETADVDLDETYLRLHRLVERAGPYVMVAVSDTGIGMDENTRSHIFEPFYTSKEIGRGTGLGLATVYGIVRQSEGHVWVYSEPGRGTTFKIYLPRVGQSEQTKQVSQPVTEIPAHVPNRKTILVAEDEGAVRELMVKICSQAGYRVLQATNGVEAIKLCETHQGRIDLLITDVIMPGLSGKVVADEVVKRRADIRILFCSGYAENAIVHHGVLDSGLKFLQKPFTPKTLLEAVRQSIEG